MHSGAVPLDLIAGEQERIISQLTSIEERLNATTAEFDKIEGNLTAALDLARDCHAAYLSADSQLRRLFNQAFFTHLMIEEDGIRSEYAEPFDVLLSEDVLDAGRAIQADREARFVTIGRRPGTPNQAERQREDPQDATRRWGSVLAAFDTCSGCRRFEYV